MNLIIRNAKIVDPNGAFHNKVTDILVKDGVIDMIESDIHATADSIIELPNLHVSIGWFDSSVCFGEPGYEEREDIANGLRVAAHSGFTTVLLQPDTMPVLDERALIELVVNRSKDSVTTLLAAGALTKGSEGKDLASLYEMSQSGAVAFGDYGKSLSNANILKLALQYTQGFGGMVISKPEDRDIAGAGVVNEGTASIALGLKGIPKLAEELQVARDLHVLEYSGGKLHIPLVSTPASVDMIRKAKAKGLDVSCSVAVHHLVLTDEKLNGFDTRYKVSPPLRNDEDRRALIKAVKNGDIDMVTSDHRPIDIEHKKIEFEFAKNGTIGLESAFGALMTCLPLEQAVSALTAGYSRFSGKRPVIEAGQQANLTLFDPEQKWTFDKEHIRSRSKNSAFIGLPMNGKVYGVINQGKSLFNQ